LTALERSVLTWTRAHFRYYAAMEGSEVDGKFPTMKRLSDLRAEHITATAALQRQGMKLLHRAAPKVRERKGE
jgi:hypothetical protein